MKIKDNLNLNGYILQNFCIDNYDSLDGINDKNKGRAVFLTGNDTNAGYGHVNVYDGTSFKALAYVDEIANNEEFRALQSKVNTIDTMLNVDSAEGVVSTWQEIQAFLDQIGEGKDLMDMLNGKLDTSGGTINTTSATPLILNTSNSAVRTLFRINGTNKAEIGWDANTGAYIYNYASNKNLGIKDDGTPHYSGNTLVHSGNIGSQSVANAQRLLSPYSYPSNVITNTTTADSLFSESYSFSAMQEDHPLFGLATIWNFSAYLKFGATQLAAHYNALTPRLALRNYNQNVENWSEWRELAFTDSDITGYAAGLKHSNGTVGAIVNSSGNVTIGANDLAGTDAKLYVAGMIRSAITEASDNYSQISNKNNILRYGVLNSGRAFIHSVGNYHLSLGTNDTERIRITDGGNVLIGTTADNGAKLQVSGNVSVSGELSAASSVRTKQIISEGGLDICAFGTTTPGTKLFLTNNCFRPWGQDSSLIDLGSPDFRWRTLYADGAYIAQGAIIKGDLHVSGNIIADGEVSAGGAGTEGGGSSSGGGGAFHSEGIAVGATQTTIAHGLGTNDIVVSIYEKDGVSGRWSIILTDVEIVDANNIIVSFGSATTVEHKVVIMGAVA